MAQSIGVYFHTAQRSQLQLLLDTIAERSPYSPDAWLYPKNAGHVTVYPYDDLLNEFEDEQIDELFVYFENFPTAILSIEFHASHGMKTCESAAELAGILLSKFSCVVDDLYGQFWTSQEICTGIIKETGSFAQSVRYPDSVKEYE